MTTTAPTLAPSSTSSTTCIRVRFERALSENDKVAYEQRVAAGTFLMPMLARHGVVGELDYERQFLGADEEGNGFASLLVDLSYTGKNRLKAVLHIHRVLSEETKIEKLMGALTELEMWPEATS